MKKDRKTVDNRQLEILELVERNKEIRSEEIAEAFGISLMTVRRDLQALEDRGLLRRTHGGAASAGAAFGERRYSPGTARCRDLISRYASRFVEDGDTIFINGSRTALNLLKYTDGRNVQVITNNGWVIESGYPSGVSVRLTGGDLRGKVLVGELTMQSLLEVQADKTFIGCAAVYEDAEYVYDIPMEIGINEIMIAKTRRHLYILADHTKLRRRDEAVSSYGSCTYDCPYTLITDDLADPEIIEALKRKGTRVITVSTADDEQTPEGSNG